MYSVVSIRRPECLVILTEDLHVHFVVDPPLEDFPTPRQEVLRRMRDVVSGGAPRQRLSFYRTRGFGSCPHRGE